MSRGHRPSAQRELPLDRQQGTARRALARLWLACREVANRKRYRLDVDEALWKRAEREAR